MLAIIENFKTNHLKFYKYENIFRVLLRFKITNFIIVRVHLLTSKTLIYLYNALQIS